MGISVKEYVESLSTYNLLLPADLSALRDQIPPGKLGDDSEHVARDLIRQGKLTKYQASNVYQGRAKGLVFGEYVVLEKIGAGGMGQVFKAQHKRMKRVVALKVLPPQATASQKNVKRFFQEVEVAAKLSHPNIVTAYDAGEAHGLYYLVMEYVDGKDLSTHVSQNGPLTVEQATNCLLQSARGLAYAHEQGVVHRDIKPSNLLLNREGVLKILDMGLARDEMTEMRELTESGQMMGTVEYMAPEQATNARSADFRSDVYSLGCTLYRVLVGRPPYGGDTPIEKILAHREKPIPSLRSERPEVPEALESLFKRMVAKEPGERIQPMSAVVEALERMSGGVDEKYAAVVLCDDEDDDDEPNSISTSLSFTGSSMINRAIAASPTMTGATVKQSPAEPDSITFEGHKPPPNWTLIGAYTALGLVALAVVAFLFVGGGDSSVDSNAVVVDASTNQSNQTTPTDAAMKPEAGTASESPSAEIPKTPTPLPAKFDFSKPIDLLELIEIKRDKISGSWKFEKGELLTPPKSGRLQIPVSPPEEYDLALTVERVEGNESMLLGLVYGGRQITAVLDGWGGKVSGLQMVDGKSADKNETRIDGALLDVGSPRVITAAVRKAGILITCNNKSIRWTGDNKRLSADDRYKTDRQDQPYVGSLNATYKISKLELLPPDRGVDSRLAASSKPAPPTSPAPAPPVVKPAPPTAVSSQPIKLTGTVDLLATIDPKLHSRDGVWTREGAVLVSAPRKGPRPIILAPGLPPEEYDLHLVVEAKEMGDPIAVGFLVGGKPVAACFDTTVAGLEQINSESYKYNDSSRRLKGVSFDSPTTIAIGIRKGRVFANVNDALAFDWSGDVDSLTLTGGLAKAAKQLFLSCQGACRFTKFDIAAPSLSPPTYSPVDLLAQADAKSNSIKGEWKQEGPDLVMPPTTGKGPVSQFWFPSPRPNEYVLTAVVERLPGGDYLSISLPYHASYPFAVVDGKDGTVSGLQNASGGGYDTNVTANKEPCFLLPGRSNTIVCTATSGSLQVQCNGVTAIRWTKKQGGLYDDNGVVPSQPSGFYLNSNATGWRISKFELRPAAWKPLSEPPTADRTKAVEAVQKLVEGASARNASAEVKQIAAQTFLRLAAQTLDKPAERYAMLDEALRLAIEAGDLVLAYNAAEDLTVVFDLDSRAVEKRLLDIFKNTKQAVARQALLVDARRLLDRAVQAGRYDLAIDLQAAIAAGLPKTGAADQQKELKTLGIELGVWKSEYEAFRAAELVLAKKPDDKEAHTAVGRYLALVAGDWKEALSHLEQGSDVILQAVAKQEAEPSTDPEKLASLGDSWWGLFEKASGPIRWIYMERAADAYRKVTSVLTGKAKATADQRKLKMIQERKQSGNAFAMRHPPDAVKYGERWYKFYPDAFSWRTAAAICEKLGGSLVTLQTPLVNDQIGQLVLSKAGKSEKVEVWTGGNDEDKEGEFHWRDGAIVGKTGYSNWGSNEPNNAGGGEDWMILTVTFEKGQLKTNWYDVKDGLRPFVCEWDR
jgi:serine/threonine protein kinase